MSGTPPYAMSRTRARGFGLPKREEIPAARITICGSGAVVECIGYNVLMKKDHVTFQRRPFLTPIWLMALAAVLGLGLAIFGAWEWATASSTTVIVIRHAEKDLSVNATDPPLTAAGQARAVLLAQMFGDAKNVGHVDAIYVSPALRNRLTAAPLAQRLGIPATVAPADDPKGLVRRVLREHAGGRVLIVGHSDTVPAIVAALSGHSAIPDLDAEEYGTMYIVTVPRIGDANLLRMHY